MPGYIQEKYKPQDDWFGGVSRTAGKEVYNESGQWDEYLPVKEIQAGRFMGSQACVSFSALNCLEILYKFEFEKEINWADRFTAKMSGTTYKGNTFSKVADTIRKKGVVLEEDWPFDRNTMTWEAYYSDIPQEVADKGKAWAEENEVTYEWVVPYGTEKLVEALKHAPLQVSVLYRNSDGTNIIE